MDCAPDSGGCRVTRLVLWHAHLAAHAHAMTNRLDTLGPHARARAVLLLVNVEERQG